MGPEPDPDPDPEPDSEPTLELGVARVPLRDAVRVPTTTVRVATPDLAVLEGAVVEDVLF